MNIIIWVLFIAIFIYIIYCCTKLINLSIQMKRHRTKLGQLIAEYEEKYGEDEFIQNIKGVNKLC